MFHWNDFLPVVEIYCDDFFVNALSPYWVESVGLGHRSLIIIVVYTLQTILNTIDSSDCDFTNSIVRRQQVFPLCMEVCLVDSTV